MSDTVLSSAADGVLTLTLNRPDALNAFTVKMKEALLVGLTSTTPSVDIMIRAK